MRIYSFILSFIHSFIHSEHLYLTVSILISFAINLYLYAYINSGGNFLCHLMNAVSMLFETNLWLGYIVGVFGSKYY